MSAISDDAGDRQDQSANPVAERILQHARACFGELGFDKATIEDIAAAAGVVRQTVYNHFSSKQDIIDRLTLREMMKVQDDLRHRIRHRLGFADKITEAIVLSVRLARENPYLQRVIYDAQASPQGKQGPIFEWQRRQWRKVIDAGRAAGAVTADLDLDAVVSWLSFCQWALHMRLDQAPADEDSLRRLVRSFMVEPILANHGATLAAVTAELAELRGKYDALKDIFADQALKLRALERGGSPGLEA